MYYGIKWHLAFKRSNNVYLERELDPAASTSMSFPILHQSSVVMLEESSKGLYSMIV